MITITVNDKAVQDALATLAQRVAHPQPVYQLIGEGIMERTKRRFGSSTGPDGAPWTPNAPSTLASFFARPGVKAKKGAAQGGKKPLIGHSGRLKSQFSVVATDASVTVGSSTLYAAIQQFGGKKSAYPNLWGDIPARPFLPVHADGTLYPDEQKRILDAIRAFLERP
jgi:phage virion morphogenesis protein